MGLSISRSIIESHQADYGQHETMVLGPRFASLFHADRRVGAWLLAVPFNAAPPRVSVQLQELNGFEAESRFYLVPKSNRRSQLEQSMLIS